MRHFLLLLTSTIVLAGCHRAPSPEIEAAHRALEKRLPRGVQPTYGFERRVSDDLVCGEVKLSGTARLGAYAYHPRSGTLETFGIAALGTDEVEALPAFSDMCRSRNLN